MTFFSSAGNTQPGSLMGLYSTFWSLFCSYEPILYIGMTFLSFLETHNQGVLKGVDFAFGALFCSCDPMLYMGLAFWISGVKFVKKVHKVTFWRGFWAACI